MLTKVVELTIVKPYGITVRFSNGQTGTHDCSKLVLEFGPGDRTFARPSLFRPRFSRVRSPDLAERV